MTDSLLITIAIQRSYYMGMSPVIRLEKDLDNISHWKFHMHIICSKRVNEVKKRSLDIAEVILNLSFIFGARFLCPVFTQPKISTKYILSYEHKPWWLYYSIALFLSKFFLMSNTFYNKRWCLCSYLVYIFEYMKKPQTVIIIFSLIIIIIIITFIDFSVIVYNEKFFWILYNKLKYPWVMTWIVSDESKQVRCTTTENLVFSQVYQIHIVMVKWNSKTKNLILKKLC